MDKKKMNCCERIMLSKEELRARNKKLLAYLGEMYAEADPETDALIYEAIKDSMELSRG
jgi:hypothetical protein